jgi:hypothetical protein
MGQLMWPLRVGLTVEPPPIYDHHIAKPFRYLWPAHTGPFVDVKRLIITPLLVPRPRPIVHCSQRRVGL